MSPESMAYNITVKENAPRNEEILHKLHLISQFMAGGYEKARRINSGFNERQFLNLLTFESDVPGLRNYYLEELSNLIHP